VKKKEFEAIGKQLMPELPGFALNGGLLFVRPLEHTLRGIRFDRSIDPRSFYVWIFLMPLCVPNNHLCFNIGWRLRGGVNGSISWNADDPNLIVELLAALKRDALPFLSRIQTPRDLADVAGAIHRVTGPVAERIGSRTSNDPINQEAIGYALARAGDIDEACIALDRLVSILGHENPWEREMAERARSLKALLISDPAAAQLQLDKWESETAENLGLDEFR
jgi:hypothetical protein